MKTRDSCQPEQAIEPYSTAPADSPSTSSPSSEKQEFFVPVPGKRKKTKKENQVNELMTMMRTVVDQHPLKDFIAFAREEAEKSRQHELKLIKLLMDAQTDTQSSTPMPPPPIAHLPMAPTPVVRAQNHCFQRASLQDSYQSPGTSFNTMQNEQPIESYNSYFKL